MGNRPTTAHAKQNANTMPQSYEGRKHCDLIVTAVGGQNVSGAKTNTRNPPDQSASASHYDIHCHKTVLSANSSYFDTILATEIPGDDNGALKTNLAGNAYGMVVKDPRRQMVKIVLPDVDKDYLKQIIDYIYSGKIELTFDNLKHVYENAEKLKVEQLISDCKSFVEQEVTASNCIKLMMCAKEMGREDIENKAFNYFLNNIPEVRQLSSGEIRRLPLGVMKKLMKSDKVNTQNAEAALRLLIMWADSDRSSRPQHLHSLMEQKIGLLPSEFLLNVLTSEEVVSSTLSALQLVTSTLRVKQLANNPTSLSSPTSPDSSASPNSATSKSNQSDQDTLLVLTDVFKEHGNGVHEKFDPDSNTWSEWTTKDRGYGYGIAVVGEWMAVIGGFQDGEFHSNVQMYNLRTKEWRAGPQMRHPRASFGCCVMNGNTIVVCGGITTNNEQLAECEMLKLNPNGTGTWEQLPPMTIKRCDCSAASINNKIFIVGGQLELDDETETVYSIVEEFDVTTKKWRTRSIMNEARLSFAIATHQNMIYVFGGWRDKKNLSSCERYDPSTDKWQYICDLPSPRQLCTAGIMGNKIHIIGNFSQGKGHPTTEIYDTQNDNFTKGPNLNNAAFIPKCVVVKKHFLFN